MGAATATDPEHWQVEAWRSEQLLQAGYPPHIAAELALNPAVDLHLAVHLVAAGCEPRLAAQILL